MADAAPNKSPFDLDTPRRPGIGDFNGALKVDDVEAPDAETMPTASEYNTICHLQVGLGKISPLLRISLSNAQIVTGFLSVNTKLTQASLRITAVSAGVVRIYWPKAMMAPTSTQPTVSSNEATATRRQFGAFNITDTNGDPGVEINSVDGTGAAAHGAFTVQIH